MPVMRLHGSRSHIQLLDMLRSDMNDFVDVLENAFDQQELSVGDERTVPFIKIRVDDCVRDPGLVFDRKEDEPVRRAWPLPGR